MNAIEINDVIKNYGNLITLDNISLKNKSDEIYGFIGLNGAAKKLLFEHF